MALDILIVDDSAAMRKTVRRVLKQTGIPLGQIYEAGHGIEALEVLKNHRVSVKSCGRIGRRPLARPNAAVTNRRAGLPSCPTRNQLRHSPQFG